MRVRSVPAVIGQCCLLWHHLQKLREACTSCFVRHCLHSVRCFLLQVAPRPSSLWCRMSQFACVLRFACYRPPVIVLHVVCCCASVAYGCLLPFALCRSHFVGCLVAVVACCTLYVACGCSVIHTATGSVLTCTSGSFAANIHMHAYAYIHVHT